MANKRVLLTNGGSLIALTVARSLARKGVSVSLVSDKRITPVGSSRSVCESLVCASSKENSLKFIEGLEKILSAGDYPVLFPIGSNDTFLVSQNLKRLSPYCRIPFLPYDRIDHLHNKKNLFEICQDLNLKTPQTWVPESLEDLENLAATLAYPCVIKLVDSTGARGFSRIATAKELVRVYTKTLSRYKPAKDRMPLVQQFIPGQGYGVSCLYNQGERRAFFTHKRIREVSPQGGASSCRESVRNPVMEEMAFRLLDHFKWHGLAMVEFKMHAKTGEPYILEVNPRFWGSLDAAVYAGVDFPWLLYQMTVEGDIDPVNEYALGVRSRCLITDMVSLGKHLLAGKIKRAYLKDFFGFHGKITHWEDFSLADPFPFLCFVFNVEI